VGVLHTSGNVAAEMPLLPLWTSELEVPLTLTVTGTPAQPNRKACGGRQGRLCEDYSSGSSGQQGAVHVESRGHRLMRFPPLPCELRWVHSPYRHGLEPARQFARGLRPVGRVLGQARKHDPIELSRNRQFLSVRTAAPASLARAG